MFSSKPEDVVVVVVVAAVVVVVVDVVVVDVVRLHQLQNGAVELNSI